MGTNTRFNWFNMVFKKMKKIWKYPSFLWAGRKKGKRFFYRLCFCAAVRMSRKTGTERLHKRTGEACPDGEDWSGRVVRLQQGLWEFKNMAVPLAYCLAKILLCP